MQSSNRRYIPLLDMFRAAAAWWVVLYHTVTSFNPGGDSANMWLGTHNPVLLVLSQGWLAVSLFVMLSGYSLSLGLRTGDIMWGAYLKARWLRVAPLYLVILMLGTLAGQTVDQPTAERFLAGVTMLPIQDAYVPRPWLSTAWSVKIELVLYLLIPVFIYVVKRYKPLPTVVMGGSMALVLFLALQPTTSTVDILYWGLPGRLVEFAVGFGLGYAGRVVAVRLRRLALTVGCGGFLVVAFVANRSGGFSDIPPATRLALFGATLALGALLLIAVDQRPTPSRSRVVAAVSAVGSWSYSTYLWQMVVLQLLVDPLLFEADSPFGPRLSLVLGVLLMVTVMLVLSWASFNLIERPFLSLRPNYIRREPEAAPAPAAQESGEAPSGVGQSIAVRTRHAAASGTQHPGHVLAPARAVPSARQPVESAPPAP